MMNGLGARAGADHRAAARVARLEVVLQRLAGHGLGGDDADPLDAARCSSSAPRRSPPARAAEEEEHARGADVAAELGARPGSACWAATRRPACAPGRARPRSPDGGVGGGGVGSGGGGRRRFGVGVGRLGLAARPFAADLLLRRRERLVELGRGDRRIELVVGVDLERVDELLLPAVPILEAVDVDDAEVDVGLGRQRRLVEAVGAQHLHRVDAASCRADSNSSES